VNVRGETVRRWLAVGLGVAIVCSLPALIAFWPAPAVALDPTRLREQILASADRPYQGYVDSQGRLHIPDLPVVGEVLALARGSTRIRAWYAGPQSWRVAVLTTTGERDIYRTAEGTYQWDFERNLIGFTPGDLPWRLPWAADVVPPDLARRILLAAAPDDRITAIPARRVAGVTAAGLRLIPADPKSTVASVDIWADPDTGLPLRVQLTGKGATEPVLVTEFGDLSQTVPDARVLEPSAPETAGVTMAGGEELASAMEQVAPVLLPDKLAGRPAMRQVVDSQYSDPSGFVIYISGLVAPGISGYGTGLSTFVVLALPGRVGADALEKARRAGGTPIGETGPSGGPTIRVAGVSGYELRADLLNALIVRAVPGGGDRRRTFLLIGMVTPDLLRQAAAELAGAPL
jgi:hypothetical protein